MRRRAPASTRGSGRGTLSGAAGFLDPNLVRCRAPRNGQCDENELLTSEIDFCPAGSGTFDGRRPAGALTSVFLFGRELFAGFVQAHGIFRIFKVRRPAGERPAGAPRSPFRLRARCAMFAANCRWSEKEPKINGPRFQQRLRKCQSSPRSKDDAAPPTVAVRGATSELSDRAGRRSAALYAVHSWTTDVLRLRQCAQRQSGATVCGPTAELAGKLPLPLNSTGARASVDGCKGQHRALALRREAPAKRSAVRDGGAGAGKPRRKSKHSSTPAATGRWSDCPRRVRTWTRPLRSVAPSS
jgi:hypothetical protein